MGKQPQSQWDFGELFPTETGRRVLSVSELTAQVKRPLFQGFSATTLPAHQTLTGYRGGGRFCVRLDRHAGVHGQKQE